MDKSIEELLFYNECKEAVKEVLTLLTTKANDKGLSFYSAATIYMGTLSALKEYETVVNNTKNEHLHIIQNAMKKAKKEFNNKRGS